MQNHRSCKKTQISFLGIALIIAMLLALFMSGCATQPTQETADPNQEWAGPNQGQDSAELPEEEQVFESVLTSDDSVWTFLGGYAAVNELSNSQSMWKDIDYSDDAWGRGVGSFGAKNGELGELSGGYIPETLLEQYDADEDSFPVYLLRNVFMMDSMQGIGSFIAEITYDDAVIVYVNGMEAFRGNVPEDGFDSEYYGAYDSVGEPVTVQFEISSQMVYAGENIISVQLHQGDPSSSDVYFEFVSLTPQPISVSTVNVGIGAQEDSVSLSWTATGPKSVNAYVEIIDIATSSGTPVVYYAQEPIESYNGYTYRADITDLAPNTQYSYTIYSGSTPKTGIFKTGSSQDGVSVLLAGDPQFGSGDLSFDESSEIMLSGILSLEEGMDFAVAMGDIASDSSDPIAYKTAFEVMGDTHLINSVIYGNHDEGTTLLSDNIYMPNMTTHGATTEDGIMSGNYWYKYGDILFMAINSNNLNSEEHALFLQESIAEYTQMYGQPDFKVVLMHHSAFSVSSHYYDDDVTAIRNTMPAIFSLYDIDLVASGHDHTYARSYLMQGVQSVTYPSDAKEVQKAQGQVLYVTTNSASATKFYDREDDLKPLVAFSDQPYEAMLTGLHFGEDYVDIITWNTQEGELIDQFRLTK